VDVAPDLSGLEVTGLRGVEIVEILIDGRGAVEEGCLLRGVREDVDARAMAAIGQWRFEPARLRHSTPPGLPVPVVLTVTLRIGQ
jgi:outer membrane biosynthesis protein TonB